MENLNLLIVFIQGLLSFFSPCILPILPIYLSILSNSSVQSLKNGEDKFIKSSLFKNTIFFTLGISTTFFILGSSVNALSSFFNTNKNMIMFIGGIIIIIMGLFYMGILNFSLLNKEKRYNMEVKEMKAISAYLLGFTFSFGWTPCVGPILASVLIIASSSSSMLKGNILIATYTIGFILPFIITALFYNKLFETLDKIKLYMDIIKKIGGLILIGAGMFMVINGFDGINNQINNVENSEIVKENNENSDSQVEKENVTEDSSSAIDFILYDQYGKEHKLSDYKGKTVFLNFWATWCPPCKGEMPHIEELYNEYNKNGDEVIILGVASPEIGSEGSKEDIIEFLNKEGYTFPVVFDNNGNLLYQYGINAFPSTFIIDKNGKIDKYIPGAMDKDTMKYLIDSSKK